MLLLGLFYPVRRVSLMDSFTNSLAKAEELRATLASALSSPPSDISAREMTTLRGRMHQLRSLTAQLERGVMESGSVTRRDSVVALRRGVCRLEKRLNGESGDSSDEDTREGSTTADDRSMARSMDGHDRRLGSLHSSVVSLKGLGTEISAEIESHVKLLSDLEASHDFVLDKQGNLHSKFKTFRDNAASNCTLYFMLAFLIIVLIASVVGI